MKKVIYFGNFFGNNGPAIVNRKIRDVIKKNKYDIVFMDEENKLKLAKKLFFNFFNCDVIHVSGINGIVSAFTVILGKLTFKKIYFSCHGSVLNESEKNNKKNYLQKFIELIYVRFSNNIIFLSNIFLDKYEKDYKNIKNKGVLIPNGYDFDKKLYEKSKYKKNNNDITMITSLGGGRREKGNLQVCKALEKMKRYNFVYNIIGEDDVDTDEIKKYNFVNYLGPKSQVDVKNILIDTNLFIQYSDLESFGIAPLEAINCACDILISNNMGISEYLVDEKELYIVESNNFNELQKKLEYKLENPNMPPKVSYISWHEVSKKYIDIWEGRTNG